MTLHILFYQDGRNYNCILSCKRLDTHTCHHVGFEPFAGIVNTKLHTKGAVFGVDNITKPVNRNCGFVIGESRKAKDHIGFGVNLCQKGFCNVGVHINAAKVDDLHYRHTGHGQFTFFNKNIINNTIEWGTHDCQFQLRFKGLQAILQAFVCILRLEVLNLTANLLFP